MSIKTYEIHNSYLQDAPESAGITRMVSEADYLSQLQQTDALQTSLNNIINALGISGEGAHSKLVIEYVHGLVAENVRAVDAVTVFSKVTEEITEVICDEIGHEKVAEILGAFNDLGNMPNTDLFTAELRAQGVDELIEENRACGLPFTSSVSHQFAADFAANLRAGRKCNIPPAGWSCTRAAGHDGPCAAVEDASHE